MILNALAKYLPTSKNSIAYTHMLFFPVDKNSGLRKKLPNAIDVRINAIATVILSAFDLILSATKLCLYVFPIIPLFKSDMKPIIKDFICSITTMVKAALAIIHGKNTGLLPLSSYERMEQIIERDPSKIKLCLSTLVPHNTEAEREILIKTVNRAGLNDSIWFLLKQNNFLILNDVIQVSNGKSALLELCIANNHRLTPTDRNILFHCFNTKPENFVVSVLLDQNVSEAVKNNLEGLSQIQTLLADGWAAKDLVVNELQTTLLQLPQLLEAVQKEKTEARNENNNVKLGLANQKELQLNNTARSLAAILNRDINLLISICISPQILEKVKFILNPSFKIIKPLLTAGRTTEFKALMNNMPDALAGSVDLETGESLVMYLLSQHRYKEAWTLLQVDSSKLTGQSVFHLLENGASLFGITQEELEEILNENHETLVTLHKNNNWASRLLKSDLSNLSEKDVVRLLENGTSTLFITQEALEKILSEHHASIVQTYKIKKTASTKPAPTQAENFNKLMTIGLQLISGTAPNRKLFLDNLLDTTKTLRMLHKDSPVAKVVLQDLPKIDVVTDGIALSNAVGAYTSGLRECLNAIKISYKKQPDRAVEIKTKHIIKRLQELCTPKDDIGQQQHQKNIAFVKSMLTYLDIEGNGDGMYNTGCIGMKQDVVNYIWNAITNAQFEDAADANIDKLDRYLSSFKDNIATRILPLDAHTRMKWGKTLSNHRNVRSVDPGDTDALFGTDLRTIHIPEALIGFDAAYRPDHFIEYLRRGLDDKNNKRGISDIIVQIELNMRLTTIQKAELAPLLTDFNGQYTDFALLCVLVNLGYIGINN